MCDIETLCIACNHINCKIMATHPHFMGGICSECQDAVLGAHQDLGDDNKQMYCTVCGSPGEVLVCDVPHCQSVLCRL